jgi:hypothetical protein
MTGTMRLPSYGIGTVVLRKAVPATLKQFPMTNIHEILSLMVTKKELLPPHKL